MAIVKRIMANTSEIDLGVTYAREFPIDDSFTTGMVWGQLMSVDGVGSSAGGGVQRTIAALIAWLSASVYPAR